jgi:hypothetical protein
MRGEVRLPSGAPALTGWRWLLAAVGVLAVILIASWLAHVW